MSPHWFDDLAEVMGPAYLRYPFTRGTETEASFIDEVVGGVAGRVLLDVGCGPGRHVLAFATRGAHVVGVDVARRFLDVARTRSGELGVAPTGLLRADAAALPLASGTVDVAVSLCQGAFGVPPLGSDDSADAAVLTELARVLRPGGHLVLTAFSAYFQVRWLEETDEFDADLGRNHERTTIHDPEGGRHDAELWTSCYTPRELRLLAASCGFHVEAIWSVAPGDYARRPPDHERPEFLVVARRAAAGWR